MPRAALPWHFAALALTLPVPRGPAREGESSFEKFFQALDENHQELRDGRKDEIYENATSSGR